MNEHSNHPHDNDHGPHTCYACGQQRPADLMRPFGHLDGHVLTWVCRDCPQAPVEAAPRTPAPQSSVDAVRKLAGIQTQLQAARRYDPFAGPPTSASKSAAAACS